MVCVAISDTSSLQLKGASQGDVVCLRVFNSLSAMKDLLKKRGERYSDRPPLPIAKMYILGRFHFSMSCHVDDPQPIMSLAYGYNLKDGDKILEALTQITK